MFAARSIDDGACLEALVTQHRDAIGKLSVSSRTESQNFFLLRNLLDRRVSSKN